MGNDKDNYEKVLEEMKEVKDEYRLAHYNYIVAIYDPTTKFVDIVTAE